jgi:hypothetical protein
MLFEVLFERFPFENFNKKKFCGDVIKNNLRPKLNEEEKNNKKLKIEKLLFDELCVKCWYSKKENRPNFNQILIILKNIFNNLKNKNNINLNNNQQQILKLMKI